MAGPIWTRWTKLGDGYYRPTSEDLCTGKNERFIVKQPTQAYGAHLFVRVMQNPEEIKEEEWGTTYGVYGNKDFKYELTKIANLPAGSVLEGLKYENQPIVVEGKKYRFVGICVREGQKGVSRFAVVAEDALKTKKAK